MINTSSGVENSKSIDCGSSKNIDLGNTNDKQQFGFAS